MPTAADRARRAAAGALLPPPLRFHERFQGRGRAYNDAEFLGDVKYLLKDTEEVDKTVFPGGDPSEAITGPRGTYGLLRAPKQNSFARYVGARLALHLEDGRVLDITVTKVLTAEDFVVQGLDVAR